MPDVFMSPHFVSKRAEDQFCGQVRFFCHRVMPAAGRLCDIDHQQPGLVQQQPGQRHLQVIRKKFGADWVASFIRITL